MTGQRYDVPLGIESQVPVRISVFEEQTIALDVQDTGAFMRQYTGPTEVTPSGETQVLSTNGYFMGSDITVDPIPSNYGLITWNGAVLTVS